MTCCCVLVVDMANYRPIDMPRIEIVRFVISHELVGNIRDVNDKYVGF